MGTLIGILGSIKKSYDEKEIIILKAIRGDDKAFLKLMKENIFYIKNPTELEIIQL